MGRTRDGILRPAALACAAMVAFAAPPALAEERVASIPGGPRLVLLPDRSVPMVACTVIVAAGSAIETPATNGAAHFLEHLLFNGTATRTREAIYAETDFLGAYNNASTQRQRTVFQLLLPSENWRAGVVLQADMILHSTLPAAMFEKERGIILEELAKDRTDAGYEAELAVSRALWGDDARSLPVLGTEASITAMDLDAVRDFYRASYDPESMTVVLMGDFDAGDAERAIADAYAAKKARQNGAARALPARPDFPDGRTLRLVRTPGLDVVRVSVLIPMPGLSSPGAAGAQLLADVLDSGEHAAVARGFERACGAPLAASVAFEGAEPWSLLAIAVDLPRGAQGGEAPGTSAPAVGAILEHLAALAGSPEWERDVESARVARTVAELQLREKMHYFGLERAALLGGSDPRLALELPRRLASAGAASVREALRDALEGPILAVVAGSDLTPGEEAIAPGWPPLPRGLAHAAELPAAGAAGAVAALPAAIPNAPRTAVSETRRVVRDDGMTLVVTASPEPRTLALHVVLRDRERLEREGGVPFGAADVVHRAMGAATEAKAKDELRGALAAIGATLKVTDADGIPYDDYYFVPEFSYVRLETIDAFAAEAHSLLGEIVLRPRLDAETFEAAKAAALVRAQRDRESPGASADRLFSARLDPLHPRAHAVDGDPDQLAKLTLEAARTHHARMIRPEHVILAVSSSLPVDRVLELVNAAFPRGAPPPSSAAPPSAAATSLAHAPPAPARLTGRVEAVITTGREQSAIVVGAPIDVAAPDEPALRVAVSLLSERLADRLREREGLAYSIGASLRLDPPARAILLTAGTRSENLERMEAGMREVAHELAAAAPSAEQVTGALNRAEGQLRMRRLTRIGQAYALAMAELRGKDATRLDEDLAELRAVTPDDVRRVAARAFALDPSIVAIAR